VTAHARDSVAFAVKALVVADGSVAVEFGPGFDVALFRVGSDSISVMGLLSAATEWPARAITVSLGLVEASRG
jgi:hypothetical protein